MGWTLACFADGSDANCVSESVLGLISLLTNVLCGIQLTTLVKLGASWWQLALLTLASAESVALTIRFVIFSSEWFLAVAELCETLIMGVVCFLFVSIAARLYDLSSRSTSMLHGTVVFFCVVAACLLVLGMAGVFGDSDCHNVIWMVLSVMSCAFMAAAVAGAVGIVRYVRYQNVSDEFRRTRTSQILGVRCLAPNVDRPHGPPLHADCRRLLLRRPLGDGV